MPCFTIQTSSVTFAQNTDLGLFAKALEGMGYKVLRLDAKAGTLAFALEKATYASGYVSGVFNKNTGVMTTQSRAGELAPAQVNAFKRAYSNEVVKATANRFGWKVSQSADTKFEMTRRV